MCGINVFLPLTAVLHLTFAFIRWCDLIFLSPLIKQDTVHPPPQGFGSVFIFYGSGSSGSGWRPIRIRIRIQSGSRALMTKNWQKITAEKKFFISKTAIYLSLGLHKVCPGYRRSLQLTKEAIQHFKTWIFSTFVGHFCLLDPDPDPDPIVRLNTDPILFPCNPAPLPPLSTTGPDFTN
jgi:hypothetical protein